MLYDVDMKRFSSRKKLLFGVILLLFVGFALLAVPRINGSENCTSVEQYDVVHDECYFICDTDQQCTALSKQVDDELSTAFAASTTKPAATKPAASKPVTNGTLYTAASTGSETRGTVYTVQADGSLRPTPNTQHQQLWQLVNALIGTKAVKKRLISFEIFDDKQNDTAASVWRSDNPATWHMNINAAFANDDKKDLIRTIIHEYGHVITLSDNQVGGITGACPRIQLDEGCGQAGSYINNFYTVFWKDYGFAANEVGSISQAQASELYSNEPQSFVSEYASTNIAEDIAESFADFVTKSKPNGKDIKDQKVQSFYQYPALVTMREQIRTASSKIVL